MKVLICSIPKSGTHLAGRVLAELGLRDSGLHLKRGNYTDYNRARDREARRREEGGLEVVMPLEESVALVEEGCFAASHLGPRRADLLKRSGFSILHTRRNLRDVTVSFARWVRETGRWAKSHNEPWREMEGAEMVTGFLNARGDEVREVLERTVAWTSADADAIVSFEDLSGANGTEKQTAAMRSIASLVDRSDANPQELINACLDEETLTFSGRRTNHEDYWSGEIETWFCKRPALFRRSLQSLNHSLGYE